MEKQMENRKVEKVIKVLKILCWIWIVFWILMGGIIICFDVSENLIINIVKETALLIIPIIFLILANKIIDKTYKYTMKKKITIIGMIVIPIILFSIICIKVRSNFMLLENNPSEIVEKYAEEVVLSNLKAPATAKFDEQNISIKEMPQGGYLVEGYVDAQNSFGALIRSKFSVWVDRNENGQLINRGKLISSNWN